MAEVHGRSAVNSTGAGIVGILVADAAETADDSSDVVGAATDVTEGAADVVGGATDVASGASPCWG